MEKLMNSLDATALRNWIRSGTALSKIWLEGFLAAKAGWVEDTNPYGLMADGLIWMDGWSLYELCPSFLDD